MSATNSTANINLPLFIGTDKPAWLTDWNGAMNAIDAAIANLQTAESGTATSLAALAQSLEALSVTVGQHTTALQTLTSAVSGNTGSINTINSLIGNGQPTTTDKTLIGAINEINAKIPEGGEVAADDVTYDNTDSGLTATDVQAAIDEVNGKIPSITTPNAEDVSYDNTQSGLTASNVQAAIDELAQTSSYSVTLLGTGTHATSATNLTLSESYDNFDAIMLATVNTQYDVIGSCSIVPVSLFKTLGQFITGYGDVYDSRIKPVANTTTEIAYEVVSNTGASMIPKIYGIKY